MRRRGGFCYELNGLFAALLRALGFEVTMLSAGVLRSERGIQPGLRSHGPAGESRERWLADVGFGDLFREPLRLDERGPQVQGDSAYRIDPAQEGR